MVYRYRLELLPTEEGKEFYKNIASRSNENAGFDLFVAETADIKQDLATLLNLGCKARMIRIDPVGGDNHVHFWLAPRSSIWKSNIVMANSMGIIDRTYRGLLMGAVKPFGADKPYPIERGTRLFQILAPDMGHISEVRIVDSLDTTERGEGGFGSTGK